MSASYQFDHNVLLAAVRVQAALELLPRIITSKETWAPWMRDNLDKELGSLPPASASSPHPKILGSLSRILFEHFSGGMGIDTLKFDQVCADDPLVLDPNYVDVPPNALPKLQSSSPDYWWDMPPPYIHLKAPSPPPLPMVHLDDVGGSSNKPALIPKIKLKVVPPNDAGSTKVVKSKHANRLSSSRKSGGVEVHLRGKKRVANEGMAAPQKKKRKSARKTIVSDDDDDDGANTNGAGPSNLGGLADPRVQSEPSEDSEPGKICDACKSRGSECVWPSKTTASATPNEKRACSVCVSQKTRCYIAGVFSIRRPRGKAAASQASLAQPPDEWKHSVTELSVRVAEVEKTEEELLTMVHVLQRQVRELKGPTPDP